MTKAAPRVRGYDQAHRLMRAQVAHVVEAGRAVCARCGKPIVPGSAWDLGHSDDRRSWTGPEHASCNRAAGARLGNSRRRVHRDPLPPPGW